MPFEALFNTARLESGLDPGAKARTSTATGLFQFIESTWLGTLARHGPRNGLNPSSRAEALALRTDPYAASLMAAHHMADNALALADRIGRQPGQVDLYLTHFLGVGGAGDFLEALAAGPDRPAAPMMPAAARANGNVFFTAGRARSLAEIYDLFARKLGAGGAAGAFTAVASASPPSLPSAGPSTPVPAADQGTGAEAQALRSARLAYLLLADLGA